MTMSKKAIIAFMLVIAMLTLAACGGTTTTPTTAGPTTTAKPGEPTTTAAPTTLPPTEITFWNGWTGPDGVTLKAEVDYYNANNKDNVTVKMDIMQHAALTEKMHAALASNTACNLHLNFTNGEYQVNGQIVPIDTIWENTSLQKSDFIESVLDVMYYKGKLYGLPFQLSSQYVFWNKDLFTQAGLNPDVGPKTWEEMGEFSVKIDKLGENIIGGGPTYNNAITWAMMALSYGGKLIEGETMDEFKAVLTDPKYIEGNKKALQTTLSMIESGGLPAIGNDDLAGAYNAGTCGMYISGAWTVAGAKAAGMNWSLSLLPAGSEGIKQPGFPIAMICMKGTEGNKLMACYKFMEFWNDNLSNKYGRDSSVMTWSKVSGFQPYLKSVASDSALTSDPIFKITNSYVDYLTQYRPITFYNFFAIDSNALVPMLENVGQKRKTIDEALAQANTDLQLVITDMQDSGLGR